MKKLMIGVLLSTMLVGCGTEVEMVETIADEENVIGYQELIKNELYYIKFDDSVNFATKYKEFTNSNPNLEVFDVEAKQQPRTYNSVEGWYIFTKEIKE